MVYFILSLASFVNYSMYLGIKKKKESDKKDLNELEDNYKKENQNFQHTISSSATSTNTINAGSM